MRRSPTTAHYVMTRVLGWLGDSDPLRRLQVAMVALLALLTVGTIGYRILGAPSVLDAMLMTVITVSTVGYEEVVPLTSPAAKLFTISLILMAVVVTAWAVRSAAELVFAEYLWTYVGRQRMQREIDSLSGHVIVCGYGRMGRSVAEELDAEHRRVVVIEVEVDRAAAGREDGCLMIEGDATRDETLEKAGIDRATALIAVTRSDPTNMMIVLSARHLNGELMIAARAEDIEASDKLRRAGANYVLHHHGTGAMHLALAVTHPAVENVLGLLIPRRGPLDLGQLEVTESSRLAGRTIIDLEPLRFGALVLAILRNDELLVPPKADLPLQPGDNRDRCRPWGSAPEAARRGRQGRRAPVTWLVARTWCAAGVLQ